MKKTSPHSIPALTKTAAVLQALASGTVSSSSSGLARHLNISQSSCYRILQTLTDMDWIQSDGDGGYEISRGLLDLVRPLLGAQKLVDVAMPSLHRLVQITNLTAKLSVLRGSEQVAVARIESTRPVSLTAHVGAHFSVVLGASGAALLSFLNDRKVAAIVAASYSEEWGEEDAEDLYRRRSACRQDRVCFNLKNHPQGINTVSVPVNVPYGPACVTLIGLPGDFDGEHRNICVQALKVAAWEIEQAVGEGEHTDFVPESKEDFS